MVSILEAKKILTENIPLLKEEEILVSNSLGRVLSKNIASPIDVPSFDNSAMDGFALCYQEGITSYKITSKIQAGDSTNVAINVGEAARIFTGAPIPNGADTIIQQELATVQDGKLSFEAKGVQKGNHIRLRGAQCKAGNTIVKCGSLITPGVIGLLSSVGITNVEVFQLPKVIVIVTGNELVAPGTPLKDGEIYNSNQAAIISYLQMLGIKEVEVMQVKDNLEELKIAVSKALDTCDIIILSGGISVGEYDFVYQVLTDEGVQLLFYKVKQKPGKPLFVGKKNDKIIFALPGNPAAVLSCMNQYVKPSLMQMMGIKGAFSPSTLLPLAHDWTKKSPLSNILKAEVNNNEVIILEGQDSFNLRAFGVANAFVLLYENDMLKQKGELVEVYNW
jgi:molybdopterin molybdotransferase